MGTTATGSDTSTSSLSFTVDMPNKSDRKLLVGVSFDDDTKSVSSVTHNSDALSLVESASVSGVKTEVWQRTAPDVGDGLTVAVTLSGSVDNVTGIAVPLWDAGAIGTDDEDAGTGASASSTVSSETDGKVIDFIARLGGQDVAAGAGQTELANFTESL